MRRFSCSTLLVSVVAAGVLVGCGSTDDDESAGPQPNGVAELEPDQILAKSKAAAKAASSVHLKGTVKGSSGGTAIDLKYEGDAGTVGTVTLNGQSMQIVVVGEDVFFKAAKDTWTELTGDDRAAELIGGRWVKIPARAPGFEAVTTLASFNRLVDEALSPDSTLTKTDIKTVRGMKVVGLVEEASPDNGTLYVATEGEPYPVQVQGDTGEGALDFLEWNEPVDLQAPPPDQVVDLSKLTRN
jgi:hypothetical protein